MILRKSLALELHNISFKFEYSGLYMWKKLAGFQCTYLIIHQTGNLVCNDFFMCKEMNLDGICKGIYVVLMRVIKIH